MSQIYGIFQISEHKSTTSIGQHVSLWNFEPFCKYKSGLFKLGTVRKSKKEIKKVSPKYGIFQISEHKSYTSIG